MTLLKGANLALRFVLELCMLTALGYWGYQAASHPLLRIVLSASLPLLAAVIWGLCVSPKATVDLPAGGRLAIEVALFALAVAALATTGHTRLALAFALLAIFSRTLKHVWQQ